MQSSCSAQNVDGLHARAGSSDVIELLGNIWNNRCLECGLPAQAVEPAASLARKARSRSCTVIQINPQAASRDEIAHYVLRDKAGQVLPALLHAAWP